MSGVAVLFHRDGRPVDPDSVWAMLQAAQYRGPDGLRVRCFGGVGLGHAKLAITPEDEPEQQPLIGERTGCSIVADARLDNRDELLARLPACRGRAIGDAELILRAYEAWGVEAPRFLLGDFAFAIWDPARHHVFCARDPRGQRSLFFRSDSRTFAATSEIHQLFQDPAVRIAPNEAELRRLFIPINAFRNPKVRGETFYEGIFAVEPGHSLVVRQDGQTVRRYWTFKPPTEIRYRSDRQYDEHFRSLFDEAIRARLRSSRPVGALLSGGIDSSSIVCVAHELYRAGRAEHHGFTSFTLTFEGMDCDESDLVGEVQRKYGFQARFFPNSPRAGWFDPEPTGFRWSPVVSESLSDQLASAVAPTGVRMLLCGDTADAYTRGSRLVFDSLVRQGRFMELQRQWSAYRREARESWRKILVRHTLVPLLPLAWQKPLVLTFEKRRLERLRPYLLPFWLLPSLRTELADRHSQLFLQEERDRLFANPTRAIEHQILYPPELPRTFAGWPLETWNPWADLRLQEFFFAIPPEQKFRPHPTEDNDYASSKRLVRRALQGVLPDSTRTRTRQTQFSTQFQQEAEERWPALVQAFGPPAEADFLSLGYVDREQYWERLQALRAGEFGNDLMYVLLVLAIESWLRSFRLPRAQQIRLTHRASSAGADPYATPAGHVDGRTRAGASSPVPEACSERR